MPMTVNCPSCFKSLKAPEHLAGKRVKCPACSGPIEVPGMQEITLMPLEEGDASSPRAPRTPWGNLNLGLLIVAINALASAGLIGLLLLIAQLAGSQTMLDMLKYVVLLAMAAQAVGFWFCSRLPVESGERGMQRAAFWFMAPAAGILWLAAILGLLQFFKSTELMILFGGAGAAATFSILAAQLFFLASLRGLAGFLKNESLAGMIFAFFLYAAAILPAYVLYQSGFAAFAGPKMPTFGSVNSLHDLAQAKQPLGDGRITGHPGVFAQPMRFPRDEMPPMPQMPRGPSSGGMTGGLPFGAHGTVDQIIVAVLLAGLVGWFAYILWIMRDAVVRSQNA